MYQDDSQSQSVTSGRCRWLPRAVQDNGAIAATDLETSIIGNVTDRPIATDYNPVPENIAMPDPVGFYRLVKRTTPEACMLDTWEVRTEMCPDTPELNVMPPSAKVEVFLACHVCDNSNECCTDELMTSLAYTPEEIAHIEAATRGQSNNTNWHSMRQNINCLKLSQNMSQHKLCKHCSITDDWLIIWQPPSSTCGLWSEI